MLSVSRAPKRKREHSPLSKDDVARVSEVDKERNSVIQHELSLEPHCSMHEPPALRSGINLARLVTIQKNELDMLYYKQFFAPSIAQSFYNWCLHELPWYHVQYSKYGRQISTPRFTTTFGKDDTSANPHSNVYKRPPKPMPAPLQQLIDIVCETLGDGTRFNFVLMNYYQSGGNSISYHSDDESFLGPHPTIASLSLGGSRQFLMKHKENKQWTEKFLLEHGDLLVMRGTTQSRWLHAVPSVADARPRINITMRRAINTKGTNNYYRYNCGDSVPHHVVNGKMVPKTH